MRWSLWNPAIRDRKLVTKADDIVGTRKVETIYGEYWEYLKAIDIKYTIYFKHFKTCYLLSKLKKMLFITSFTSFRLNAS